MKMLQISSLYVANLWTLTATGPNPYTPAPHSSPQHVPLINSAPAVSRSMYQYGLCLIVLLGWLIWLLPNQRNTCRLIGWRVLVLVIWGWYWVVRRGLDQIWCRLVLVVRVQIRRVGCWLWWSLTMRRRRRTRMYPIHLEYLPICYCCCCYCYYRY